MNRNRRIFIITFVVFVLLMIAVAVDMARRTTAPWNKKKQLTRAIPVTEKADSVGIK